MVSRVLLLSLEYFFFERKCANNNLTLCPMCNILNTKTPLCTMSESEIKSASNWIGIWDMGWQSWNVRHLLGKGHLLGQFWEVKGLRREFI